MGIQGYLSSGWQCNDGWRLAPGSAADAAEEVEHRDDTVEQQSESHSAGDKE